MRFAIVLLLALPLAAQTVEERLHKLEQEVADLKKENDELRRALGLEVVARQASANVAAHEPGVQLGGLIQVQADHSDASNDRFFLRRARISVGGRFVEHFDFRTEFELAGALGEASALRAQLTDAYITWNRFERANIRAGQFKTPFGFEQLFADAYLYTIERSLASDRLTPGRQIGIQLSGRSAGQRLAYAAGIFNGNGTNVSFNDNDRFLQAARLSYALVPARWSIGANAFRSRDTNVSTPAEFSFRNNLFTGMRNGIAADTQFARGRLELWAEAFREDFSPLNGPRVHATGAYEQAAYYVVPNVLQFVGKYETFLKTRTSTVGVNYYLKQHDLKLQLDWLRTGAQQRVVARLQTVF